MRKNFLIFFNHFILIIFSMLILLPLLWILRNSFTDKLNAYKIPPELSPIIFDNYIEIFTKYPFGSYFLNSFVVAMFTTLISLPLAAMIAYAFAKFNTGGKPLRLFILSTQMIPPIIIVLPIFSIYLSLNLLNNYFGLIIAHTTIILPFLSWMLISFYSRDIFMIESAARSDGATRFQAFYLIALPLIAPGLIAAGLLGFILSWNEFIFVLILSGKATSTLPIGLSTLSTHRGVEIAQLAAATTLTIVPALFLLPFIKKYLIKGLSLGALK